MSRRNSEILERVLKNKVAGIERLFKGLYDDVLDEYNQNIITREEMANVMKWLQGTRRNMIEDLSKKLNSVRFGNNE